MNVLFITNVPSPYRIDFFNELGKLCNLTVLFETTTAKSRDHAWIKNNYTYFHAVFLKGIKFGEAEAFCPKVIAYISEKKYHIIVVGMYSSPTGMFAIQYMKTKKIPFIISSDGGIPKEEHILTYNIKKYFISSAQAWLSTGKLTSNYLKYYGANPENIYVYPFSSLQKKDLNNDIFFDEDKKEKQKHLLNITADKVILSVGRFSYENGYGKGFDTLLRMAKKIPNNISIYIVGDKPTEEFLKWKKSENLDNVYFIGFKRKEELKKYYAAADLFVLMTKYDVWGLVINEAMTFGLPVISTDKCVAAVELIENDYNGYIIPVGNELLLFEKTMHILDSDIHRKTLGKNNINKIKNYTVENMAKVHMDIFQSIVSKRNNAKLN